jgi:hypothetical protein
LWEISKLEVKAQERENMAVFNDDDSQTLRSLALTMAGFSALTIFLIILAAFIA